VTVEWCSVTVVTVVTVVTGETVGTRAKRQDKNR
jgi:hypothetical protein